MNLPTFTDKPFLHPGRESTQHQSWLGQRDRIKKLMKGVEFKPQRVVYPPKKEESK